MSKLNDMDPAELAAYVTKVRTEPAHAERSPQLAAKWLGGDRSRVQVDGKTLDVSGPEHLDPMQLVLAAYASCVIELIATHATLMGLAVQSIEIALDAHFDVRTYLGLVGPSPGYDRLAVAVRLRAEGITTDQVRRLQEAIEHASPVGATLSHPLRIEPRLEIVTESASG